MLLFRGRLSLYTYSTVENVNVCCSPRHDVNVLMVDATLDAQAAAPRSLSISHNDTVIEPDHH
jgi:hypothetical protein